MKVFPIVSLFGARLESIRLIELNFVFLSEAGDKQATPRVKEISCGGENVEEAKFGTGGGPPQSHHGWLGRCGKERRKYLTSNQSCSASSLLWKCFLLHDSFLLCS
jgi:hypothetical protein